MPRRAHLLALPLALALAAGACGGDENDGAEAPIQPPPTTAQAQTPTTPAPATTETTTVPTTPTTATAPPTTPTQTTPTTPTTTSTQPSGGAPAGCPSAVGGFIRDVRTSGVDCGAAGTVATAWFDAVHDGAAPDAPITAAGFACGATLVGERASVTCSGDGGSVSFTASP